jgi:hypothetical protein
MVFLQWTGDEDALQETGQRSVIINDGNGEESGKKRRLTLEKFMGQFVVLKSFKSLHKSSIHLVDTRWRIYNENENYFSITGLV